MARLNRRLIQTITTITTNGYFKGFTTGTIYRGKLKMLCSPGLNCYSCPGSLGSCPIGALQSVIGSIDYKLSFYVLGIIGVFGSLFGRLICGWLCPFGFIQELLYKIKARKFRIGRSNPLKYLKYIILMVFVILMPMFVVNQVGIGNPTFCKYICPAGTLEAGIPLTLLNPSLKSAIGIIFSWKVFLLLLTIFGAVFIYRPFCRFICPLGAIYGLFNPISLYRLEIAEDRCTKCNACTRSCKLDIETYKTPNSPECIRCGDCIKACPTKAIRGRFGIGEKDCKVKEEIKYG